MFLSEAFKDEAFRSINIFFQIEFLGIHITTHNMIWLRYLNWKTDLLQLLYFLLVLLCAGAASVLTVAGREQSRFCLLTLFVGHPAEAGDGPLMATCPGRRVSMRISKLLEIVKRHDPVLKTCASVTS